jgi:phytoene synthase
LYRRAESGIAALPRDCRPAIHAARLVYAEIGHQLQRGGLDSVNHRVVVSKGRKIALMARATGAALALPSTAPVPLHALSAIQYLVDAVPADAPTRGAKLAPPALPNRSFDERVVWLIDLFERQAAQNRGIRRDAA